MAMRQIAVVRPQSQFPGEDRSICTRLYRAVSQIYQDVESFVAIPEGVIAAL